MADGEHKEAVSPATPASATPEDWILLQSTVDALRQERDALLRRLQAQESASRERVQIAEARLREAQAQVDALKRAAQAARAQFEDALARAQRSAEEQRQETAQWQAQYSELLAVADAAQCRVADLETENAVLAAELARLEQEQAGLREQLELVSAKVRQLEDARAGDAQRLGDLEQQLAAQSAGRQEAERLVAEARQYMQALWQAGEQLAASLAEVTSRAADLERQCAGYQRAAREQEEAFARQRAVWEQERADLLQRWQSERDELARSLEEAHNQVHESQREADRVRAQLCSLQMREQSAADEIARLEHELKSAVEERAREREVYEQLAQQRLAEYRAAEARWQSRLEEAKVHEQQQRAELEAALARVQEQLEAASQARAQAEATAAQLASALREREEAVAQQTQRAAGLAAQLEQAAHEQRELEQQHQCLTKEAEALSHQLLEARRHLEETRSRLSAARAQHVAAEHRFVERCLSQSDQISALLEERDRLDRALRCSQALVAEKDRSFARTTVLLHSASLRAAEAATRAEGLRSQLELVLERLAAERASYQDQLEWRQREQRGLAERVLEQGKALFALWDLCTRLEQQHLASMQERAQLEEAVARLSAANEAAEQQRRILEAALEEERALRRSEEAAHGAVLEDKERLLETLRLDLQAKQEALNAVEQERKALLLELEETQGRLTSLQSEYASLCETAGQATAELQERIQSLENELAEVRAAYAASETNLAESSQREREWEARLASKEDELARLRLELAQAREHAQREREARASAEGIAAEAKRQWELLQEQAVSILQSQEVLAHENDALRRGQQEMQARVEQLVQERERAVRDRADALRRAEQLQALLVNQQREFGILRQRLDAERSSLRDALEAARAQQAQLAAQVTQLQQELEQATKRSAPSSSLDLVEFERERTELRAQVEKLSAVIRQLGQEREEQRVAALQTQASLNQRIEELAAERSALALRVAELETLSSQLERECDRLRRERLSPEELRRHKAEIARLEARVEELERLRSEASQNHSAVVANYMLELNQRAEALQQKESELQQLQAEMVALQQMYEETQAKLDQEREERSALLAELDELRRSATAARLKTGAPPPAQPAAKPEVKASPLRFAESTPTAAAQPKNTLSLDGVTIVHLEENKDYREAVQRVAKAIPNSRYGNTWEPKQLEKTQSLVLVVNLLNRAHDPITALARASADDPTRRVFAYCADGKFGFLFGPATFFTPPLEPSACSAWLVASCGSPHKLLVASSDIEMTSRLRTEFNRIRCSTSVALDLRQVLDLLPLIQPDVVLVDLSLPRGDGLRLISRLRSEEKTARLPLAVLLPSPQNIAEFRQSAQLAARDGTLSPASLTAALSAELGVSLPAGEGDTLSPGLVTPKAG